jgi:oligopeptide transport system substrate-binding protein
MINKMVLMLCVLSLASCVKDKTTSKNKTVFRYNESAGITSLDPAFAKDQATIWAANQLFNGLVQLDEALKVNPCIAKRWEISDDGLIYKFYLRDDVYFHDHPVFENSKGRKVVAADFVFSFLRILDPKTASPGVWVFNSVKYGQEDSPGFTALNDTVFQISLKKSFPPFLSLLSMPYCSVIPKEAAEHYGKDFRSNPVGTGPFQFKLWKEGVKLVMVKNPHYFEKEGGQQLPYLDAVAVTFIADKQSAFLEFIKGKLDFISGIDPSYKDELLTKKGELNPKYSGKFKMQTQPYLNTEYLGFLVDETKYKDAGNPLKLKKIRQAINYGFDRKKMMKYLRNNIGTPGIYGFIPKGMPGFDTSFTAGYNYDPDKSRQLMAEAGYPNGKGLPEIVLSTTSAYLDLCKYIQHQLEAVNIKIKIEVNPPATLREMVAQSKVTFFRGSWIADYPDAENYLSLFYSENYSPQGPNYTHFSSKGFDDLFNKAQTITNDSLRYIYYRELNKLLMEESPVVVLYYDQVLRFYQNNIFGLVINPMNLLTLKRVRKSIF